MVLGETADTAISSDAGHTRIRLLSRLVHTTVSKLTGADRRVLGLWAGAHLGLAVLAWMSSWINGQRGIYNALLGIYGQWDYVWYQNIAAHGYFSGQSFGSAERVFLPGDPAALVAVHLFTRNWVVAGLLVSLVAGGVALVCIGRLGGERAALYMLTAPAAMYLIVGYSESLFLALALPAWMAAKRRNRPLAALLAGLAGLVRVNGLFLIAALLVAAATSERGMRLRATAWASVSLIGPAAYAVYLRIGTGSWAAWLDANKNGWGLRFVGTAQSLHNTWNMAFGHSLTPERAAMFQLEIGCMAVGVVLAILLLWRNAWPEATYVGLTFAALGTTTFYQSVPRALLIAWPLYLLLAQVADRRPWVGQIYLWICAPLAVVVAMYFFLGQWAL